MTISCPGCGQPCSSVKKKCAECLEKDKLAAVFTETDAQLAEVAAEPDLKLAGLLDKATPEQLAALSSLSPEEEAALDTITAQELRLYGTRVRFGRHKGADREYIKDGLLKGFEKALKQIEEVYERAGKPKFDSRQMVVAVLNIAPHFLVTPASRQEMTKEATTYKGEPAVFAEGETSPLPACARTIDSLLTHLPEIFADCEPGQKYQVEAMLKWSWPVDNETAQPIKPTVH